MKLISAFLLAVLMLYPGEALREDGQAPVVLGAPLPPPPAVPMPQSLRNYKPVTAARLKNPDAGDWLMVRRTWDGWGYSPLDQITAANAPRLQPAWVVSTGVTNGHEAPPIVNDGVMFVATPGNQVIALRRQDRRSVVALQAADRRGHRAAARHQPRCRAVRRQGVLRRRGSGARRARREDRQGSVDCDRRGQPQRLLHVGRAAGRRRAR